MVGPGASEIVLYFARHRCLRELPWPVIFSVVALDSEEPIEDLLFPNVGSTSDVSSDRAFSLSERIVPSTTGSGMVRVTACGMKVAVPSGKSDRVPTLAPGSSVPVDPTADVAYGSDVSVIGDEGAFRDMDQTEFVKARCEPASMPRASQEGAQRPAKFDRCEV